MRKAMRNRMTPPEMVSEESEMPRTPSTRQERSNGHFYGVGLINWWDPKGTRNTLEELKALGLKTFLLPLNPGKDDDGNDDAGEVHLR